MSNLRAQGPALGISQLKKYLNSGSIAASSLDAMNVVVPGVPATTIRIATTTPQSSSVQSSPLEPSLIQPNLARLSLSPTLTAGVHDRALEAATGAVESGLQAVAYNTTTQSPAVGDLSSSPVGGHFGAGINPGGIVGSASNLSMAGVLIPTGTTSQANETSMMNRAQPSATFAAVEIDSASGVPKIVPAEPTVPAGVATMESTLALALSATTVPTTSSGAWPKAGSGVLQNSANRGGASATSLPTSGTGLRSAEERPQIDGAIETNVSGSVLVANANSGGEEVVVLLPSSVDVESRQANSATAGTLGTAIGSIPPHADSLPAQAPMISTKDSISASSVLNTSAQSVQGVAALQTIVRTISVASPSVRDASLGLVGRTSAATLPSPMGSASGRESSMADQTPFSVFFSGPGPGTESAASTLPRMILPANGSAVRNNSASGGSASSVGSLAGSSVSNASQSNTSQNPAPTNAKDSLTLTASGSLQATQPSPRDAVGSAASMQFPDSQSAAAAMQPLPASALVASPLGSLAAIVNDSLAKPDPLPAGAPAIPANSVPAAGEPLSAATPGPVQVAQLVNRIEQSEMRIGMNTTAFGSVEVRTVVHANDVGLVIGSEKGDLRTLLSNDIPAITSTLQQQNLRLNSVNFMQGFAFSNNNSGGGDSQQRCFVPMRAAASPGLPEPARQDSVEPPPTREFRRGGLSILA